MNSFGQLFRVTTFGESHGGAVGAVVDGCPPGLELSEDDIQPELDRRKPGQSSVTSPREEHDRIQIMSGVFEGQTTGTPIMMLAYNKDARPEDYEQLSSIYRPSHADYTFDLKYGRRDWRGGGRASARETLARVAAGAVARKFLRLKEQTDFVAYVEQIGELKTHIEHTQVVREQVEKSPVRCPDDAVAREMLSLIHDIKQQGDSVGGVICGVIRNVPKGLGEPVFDKLPAELSKAMMGINAVKGFEIGRGFAAAALLGSQNNDEFYLDDSGSIRTRTNNAGGTLGGISTGEDIYFRVAFKPPSTIAKPQATVSRKQLELELEATGRHDPCVVPRAVPIVEAMAALVVMDFYLRQRALTVIS